MLTIKNPDFDGKFYPKDTVELENQLEKMLHNTHFETAVKARGLIVPHSGYFYCGQLAADTFKYLDRHLKNIFILAPAHYMEIKGIVICNTLKFSTPLGQISVNSLLNSSLLNFPEVFIDNAAFEKEYGIEVLLPFIQKLLPEARIIPIVYNVRKHCVLQKIIENYFDEKTNAFIVSSDLSHYYAKEIAEKLDEYTARLIESGDIKNLLPSQACGSKAIMALTEFAVSRGYSLKRVKLANSAAKNHDAASVVGYGGWYLFEG
jgi:hypothetical protein